MLMDDFDVITDWEYLWDDSSDLALKIKDVLKEIQYLYEVDILDYKPRELIYAVEEPFQADLRTLLMAYSDEPTPTLTAVPSPAAQAGICLAQSAESRRCTPARGSPSLPAA